MYVSENAARTAFNAVTRKDGNARLSVAGMPTRYSLRHIFSLVALPGRKRTGRRTKGNVTM